MYCHLSVITITLNYAITTFNVVVYLPRYRHNSHPSCGYSYSHLSVNTLAYKLHSLLNYSVIQQSDYISQLTLLSSCWVASLCKKVHSFNAKNDLSAAMHIPYGLYSVQVWIQFKINQNEYPSALMYAVWVRPELVVSFAFNSLLVCAISNCRQSPHDTTCEFKWLETESSVLIPRLWVCSFFLCKHCT